MRNSQPPATVESPTTTGATERRYIFDGTYKKPPAQSAPRSNRPARPRKRPLFSIMLLLISLSVIIVFYIWNKFCVNRLTVEINDINRNIQRYENINTSLDAEISKKSSLERVQYMIDTRQINLVIPKEPPETFSIDENRLKDLQIKE